MQMDEKDVMHLDRQNAYSFLRSLGVTETAIPDSPFDLVRHDAGAAAFSRLLSDVTDGAWDSYLEEHRERPPAVAIRIESGYYVITEMRVYDGVLY